MIYDILVLCRLMILSELWLLHYWTILLGSVLFHFENIFQLFLGIFAITPSRKGVVEGLFQTQHSGSFCKMSDHLSIRVDSLSLVVTSIR